jgi:hypothetical protein
MAGSDVSNPGLHPGLHTFRALLFPITYNTMHIMVMKYNECYVPIVLNFVF